MKVFIINVTQIEFYCFPLWKKSAFFWDWIVISFSNWQHHIYTAKRIWNSLKSIHQLRKIYAQIKMYFITLLLLLIWTKRNQIMLQEISINWRFMLNIKLWKNIYRRILWKITMKKKCCSDESSQNIEEVQEIHKINHLFLTIFFIKSNSIYFIWVFCYSSWISLFLEWNCFIALLFFWDILIFADNNIKCFDYCLIYHCFII
jgi:hypothetical protein